MGFPCDCDMVFPGTLMMADLVTDALVIARYYEEGHTVWGSLYLAFIFGALELLITVSFLIVHSIIQVSAVLCSDEESLIGVYIRAAIQFAVAALMTVAGPIAFSIALHYFDVKPLLSLGKGCAPDEHVTPTIVLARLFRPTLTSMPQFALQLSVALITADSSPRVLISMAVGGLSILSTTAIFTYKLSANMTSHRRRAVIYRTLAVALLEFSAILCISSSIAIFEETALYGGIAIVIIGAVLVLRTVGTLAAKFDDTADSQDSEELSMSMLRTAVFLPSKNRWRHILTIMKVATPAVFAISALPFTIAAFFYDASVPTVHNLTVHLVGCAGVILFFLSVGYSYAGYGKMAAFQVYMTDDAWPEEFFPFEDPGRPYSSKTSSSSVKAKIDPEELQVVPNSPA